MNVTEISTNNDFTLAERQEASDLARSTSFGLAYRRLWDDVQRIDSRLLAEGRNYNCSAAYRSGQLHFAYRHFHPTFTFDGLKVGSRSTIWLTTLSDWGTPTSSGKPLALPKLYEDVTSRFGNHEDPRLFVHNDRMFLTFVTRSNLHRTFSIGVRDLTSGEVMWIPFGNNLTRCGTPLNPILKSPSKGHEKNWGFFSLNGCVHFVYSIRPHLVVRLLDWQPVATFVTDSVLNWEFGEPRGGAPPVLVNGEYFCFFHSSIGIPPGNSVRRRRVYALGVYAFRACPPFRITRWPRLPIAYGDHSMEAWADVIFPGAALLSGNQWRVYYGHNDRECRVLTIQHDRLEASLRRAL